MRKITTLLVCFVALLAFAAPAFAQTATQDAYGNLAGTQAGPGSGGSVQATSGDSTLPFTGLQLGLVAVAGVGLLGVGVALRRGSRMRESTL